MVRTKGAHCGHCCCADCGVHLPSDAYLCCGCVCDELCVTVALDEEPSPCEADCDCDATADCSCVSGFGVLSWNSDNCNWTGTIGCGTASIGLTVQIFNCTGTGTGTGSPGAGCYVCVTSTCIGMTGACNTRSDCFSLDSCGEYAVDCDVMGGFTINFQRDISGCNDADCGSADITITCTSFVNPNYDAANYYEICRDCNCVCEYMCITYTENNCSIRKLVQWDDVNNRFQDIFDGDCGWAAQTVTIELVAGADNCCYWELTTSRGTVSSTNPVPADCPRPDVSWTITDPETGTGSNFSTVEMECASCDKCITSICCPHDLPTIIYGRLCTPCGSWCTELELTGLTTTSAVWRSGTVTIQVTDGVDFLCYDLDVVIEFECLSNGTLWNINAYCPDDLTTPVGSATGLSVDCDPFCGSGTPSIQGNEVSCNYQGSSFYVDDAKVCISEEPC